MTRPTQSGGPSTSRGPGRTDEPQARGRVYAVTRQQDPSEPEGERAAPGTFLLYNSWASILIDTGASHSFLSAQCARALGLAVEPLSPSICVDTPIGDGIVLDKICRACEVRVADHSLIGDLIVLDMTTFDVILGMDWLARYKAIIDCYRRRVTVTMGTTKVSCSLGSRSGVLLSALYTVEEVTSSAKPGVAQDSVRVCGCLSGRAGRVAASARG